MSDSFLLKLKGLECRALQSLGDFPASHPMPYIFMEWKELVASPRRSPSQPPPSSPPPPPPPPPSPPPLSSLFSYCCSICWPLHTQVSKPCWVHRLNGGTGLLPQVAVSIGKDATSLRWKNFIWWTNFPWSTNWLNPQPRWPSKLAQMPKHCLKGPSHDVLWVHKSARWSSSGDQS